MGIEWEHMGRGGWEHMGRGGWECNLKEKEWNGNRMGNENGTF